MIRDFLRYSKNFFKHKLFRLIIYGFIAFIIFSFVKIKGVNAAVINGATTKVYFETQNCDINSGTFNCIKGTSYKFQYQENTTNNDSTFYPLILNNSDNYVLFKNMIFDIELASPINIDNTNRSILLNFNNYQYLSGDTNTYGSYFFVPNFLDTYGLDSNDTRDNRLMPYATYNFKPYYATYTDSNNVIHDCGIILYQGSGGSPAYFYMVFDIPLNTIVTKLTLYLGDYHFNNTYNVNTLSNTSIKVPGPNYQYYDSFGTGQSNLYYYGRLYNNYRTTNNDQHINGLLMLQKGVSYYQPKFNVNNSDNFFKTTSDIYTSSNYKYYFDSYSSDLKQDLENSVTRIEDEIEMQQSAGDFDSLLNGFINSETSSSFTNLFTSLFTYPLSKLNEAKTEPLFNNSPVNNKGTGGLNLAVCTGRNIIGGVPEDRIEVPFYGGVKWTIPCFHYDIFSQMHDENTSFYPTSIDGHAIQSGRSTNFYSVYRIIIRGILVYLFFINLIDIYKYVLDSDRKEIDVIDL